MVVAKQSAHPLKYNYTSIQREQNITEILQILQPGLVHRNVILITKTGSKNLVTHKQVFGFLVLNKHKQAQQNYAMFIWPSSPTGTIYFSSSVSHMGHFLKNNNILINVTCFFCFYW